jgi:hypothetical protein
MKRFIITEQEKKEITNLYEGLLLNEERPNATIDKKLFVGVPSSLDQGYFKYNLKKILSIFSDKQTLSIKVKPLSIQNSEFVYCHTLNGSDVVIIPPGKLTRISSELLLYGYGWKVKSDQDFDFKKSKDQNYLKSFCNGNKSLYGHFIWSPHSESSIFHSMSSDYSGSEVSPSFKLRSALKNSW